VIPIEIINHQRYYYINYRTPSDGVFDSGLPSWMVATSPTMAAMSQGGPEDDRTDVSATST